MSSGYEWANSAEAFLAATSNRRGYSGMSFYPPMLQQPIQQHQPIQCMPQAMTPTSIDSYDMEVIVADANGPMVQLVTKRKLDDENEGMFFKRQRLQW